MSRSKKWHLEWAFFLGGNGRRQYHTQCRNCSRDCKQSFRVKQLTCPHYSSRRAKNCMDMGGKTAE